MIKLLVFDKETFNEVVKEHNIKNVFLIKQTKKNYDLLTIQHEAKFTAAFVNTIVMLIINSKVASIDDEESIKQITDEFEQEVNRIIEYFTANNLNIREGVYLE